jgi:hypothetical protein
MERPILASLLIYAVVFTVKHYGMFGQGGHILLLASLVLVGAVTYIGSMLVLDRHVCRDSREFLGAFFGVRVQPNSYQPRPLSKNDETPLAGH